MSNQEQHLHTDTWQQLRELTAARIGLGRAGTSLPTSELLKFQLAHAQAIDAVHSPLNGELLCEQLAALSYQRTRLVRAWTHLERQRGGLGFVGGPGETQIETV